MTKDIEAAKLLPCPFCGGEGHYMEIKHDDGVKLHYTRCRKCYAAHDGHTSKDSAIKAWNTRQALDTKTEQAVDVEALKRYNPEPQHDGIYVSDEQNGWNACIDHLSSQGYLKTPEPKTKSRAQTDFVEKEVANTALHKCVSKRAEPKTEVDVKEMWEQLDHFWRWIERAHFDDSLSVDECLGVLVHSPYAPWNSDREKWDTSHKDYDAKIDAVVEASKNKPDNPLQPIEGLDDAIKWLGSILGETQESQDGKTAKPLLDAARRYQALCKSQDQLRDHPKMVDEGEKPLTAKDICRMIRMLPPEELYRLADIMDFGDDGMWSQDVHEAIEKQDMEWSEDGKTMTCELMLGMCLPSVTVKITYENIAAEDDDPNYGEYKTELIPTPPKSQGGE